MDSRGIERAFAGIRPEETQDVLGMLSLWERAGWITLEEASEWRRRISGAHASAGPYPCRSSP